MTRLNLLNRIITATVLVALAVTLGVWLTRAPLTAAPAAVPAKFAPEPTLAPPPTPVPPVTMPTTIDVPVEVEVAAASPAAKPAEPKPEPQPIHPPRRRGLFRRRWETAPGKWRINAPIRRVFAEYLLDAKGPPPRKRRSIRASRRSVASEEIGG